MRFAVLLRKFGLGFLTIALVAFVAFGQRSPSRVPTQEKLLNGLKVLMWADPAASDVTVRIRIHSGSAFDPQGREGVMKLLSEILFPNQEAREFFKEDLGGGLEIISNYDYIQINASSKPSEFLTMLEALGQAISNPTIDKETTEKLKASHLTGLAELERNAAYLADRAVAARLLGAFPYGRAELGSEASVKKIDFADLRDAQARFLTADNATIAITGNFNPDTAFRAVRRYFGSWLKADRKVPSTFRQPDEPDTKPLIVSLPGASDQEVRFALRGVARSDKDYPASAILSRIVKARLQALSSIEQPSVASYAHILPGVVVVNYRSSTVMDSSKIAGLFERIKEGEFNAAKSETIAEAAKRPAAEQWLDADTYKISANPDEVSTLQNVTLADIQRVAARLAKNPIVTVVVGNSVTSN